jgi:hypothetical protein
MAGNTGAPLNLYLPGGGSTGVWTPDEVADIDRVNQNFVDINEWAENLAASSSFAVRATSDSFASGSFINLGFSVNIADAPAGVYLVSTNILVSNTLLSAGTLRIQVNGVSLIPGDTRFDSPAGSIISTGGAVTGRYTHAGGVLGVVPFVLMNSGAPSILSGSSIMVARLLS